MGISYSMFVFRLSTFEDQVSKNERRTYFTHLRLNFLSLDKVL